jgi:hypothetical protein
MTLVDDYATKGTVIDATALGMNNTDFDAVFKSGDDLKNAQKSLDKLLMRGPKKL